jgi:hypothetical protein
LKQQDSAVDIEEFKNIFNRFDQKLFKKNGDVRATLGELGIDTKDIDSLKKLKAIIEEIKELEGVASKTKEVFGEKISYLSNFERFSSEDLNNLKELLNEYKNLKNPLFGYFLKGKQVAALDLKFRNLFPAAKIENPRDNLNELTVMIEIVSYIEKLSKEYLTDTKSDCIGVIHFILQDEEHINAIQEVMNLQDDVEYLEESIKKYPNTFKKLGIKLSELNTFSNNKLTGLSDLEFNRLVRYLSLKQKLEKEFNSIPEFNYYRAKKDLEELVTTQMTHIMDGRLVNFYDQNRSDAKTLRDIIRKKQRFPKNEFLKLKEAFPCILAGIRDYAEYIPLEPEIFDLVIIDEASQVSIAQAFPALLRAKKVLILGDRKQFSNVKSAQARTATNREYLNNLERTFQENVANDPAKLTRLAKFNIKTSILEFFEFISNYHTQLLKHFRGYKETISYSNKYFYQNNLQVMKIRGKPVDDVLKFSFIKHDGKVQTPICQRRNSLLVN